MELSEFLIKAKINTYAASGEGGEKILEDGSKELVYENGIRKYRDKYFGFKSFIGEEIVWENGKAIWGMNYCGGIISEEVDVKQIYQFLQKAMKLVKIERPFRGPENFQEGEWDYTDKSDCSVNEFSGTESIYFQKKKVYELKYIGGIVK